MQICGDCNWLSWYTGKQSLFDWVIESRDIKENGDRSKREMGPAMREFSLGAQTNNYFVHAYQVDPNVHVYGRLHENSKRQS